MEFVVYVGGMSNEDDLNVSVERPTRFCSFLLLVLLNRQLANGVTSRRQMRTRELILTISSSAGFDWHLMIEAHKGRHHSAKGGGGGVASTLLGPSQHWDNNNVDKSYSGGNASNESAAGHQRAPLFDWESNASSASGPSATSWDSSSSDQPKTGDAGQHHHSIQEVTTTLGQTAFLHCRVRYLADRRVKKPNLKFFPGSMTPPTAKI